MGGWIEIRKDIIFLGYGPYGECTHCHNKGWLEVYQPYSQQWAYSVIPTPKNYKNFFVRCRVCHRGFEIPKKDKKRILEVLEAGKSATKQSFQKMSEKDRTRLLKHLNRNGFTQISQG